MAYPDGEERARRARRTRNRRMPSPADDNDWSAGSQDHRHSMPYRSRAGKRDFIEGTDDARPSSHRPTQQISSHKKPNSVMSVARRPPPAHPRRGRDPLLYEHTSGTDSRRSSRKDYMRASPRYYNSTPGSKPSSHTTVSDSDEESTWTPSTPDEEHGHTSVRRYRESRSKSHRRSRTVREESKYPAKPPVPFVPEVEEIDDDEESSEEDDSEEDDEEDTDEDEDEDEEDEEIEERREPRKPTPQIRRPREYIIEELEVPQSPPRHWYPAHRAHHASRKPAFSDEQLPLAPKRSPRRAHGSDIVFQHPSIRRSHTTGGSHAPSILTTSTRRSSAFETFLPQSARGYDSPIRLATCVTCREESPSQKTEKLRCGHRMCKSCLREGFRLSAEDPQHPPPSCCKEYVPYKQVEHLFGSKFRKGWNRTFAKGPAARNQLYCPSRECGAPIADVFKDREYRRKCGVCARCGTNVCGACRGKWHVTRECPTDEVSNDRPGEQFCTTCGEKWKACECATIDYETVEHDGYGPPPVPTLTRSETFPMTPRRFRPTQTQTAPPLGARMFGPEDDMPPSRRAAPSHKYELAERFQRLTPRTRDPRDPREPPHERERERDYYEDDYRGMRGRGMGEDDPDDDHDDDHDDSNDDYDYDINDVSSPRQRRRHHEHDEYRRGGTVVPPPPAPPAAPHGFDRTARTADYISDVSKARGVRGSSMERRLADRFSHQRAGQAPPTPTSIHHPPLPHLAAHQPHPHLQHGLPPMAPMMPMGPPPHAPMVPPSAPVPPPAPLLRRHSGEEEVYKAARPRRTSERMVVGRGRRDFGGEEAGFRGPPNRRHSIELAERSTMAGLNGIGRGMNRVHEWRNYVEPGVPPPEEDENQFARRRIKHH